ncbi:hypothetical protein NSU_4875 [Novosphingobium pentaromativorans US6-1]|uniref:Glycosyltransferase RgtA/B/C/D-like domain-containing protein n=1 Tax=Novosphingobium pentaromativorans US6-1 TaxID=1088721 RepID=G6EKK4_9SPHN|nr:hypothetical protein NSU_4875 [Novosphingobium pentaromativorans US6-1]
MYFPALALFLAALAIRLVCSPIVPLHPDEIFHILTATSWSDDGSYRLGDGSYTRGWIYTVMAGESFHAFGHVSVFLARLPAILAGALVVPVIFVWISRSADRTAGWISALLVCCTELMIRTSDFARFYSLQALLVTAAAAMIYAYLLHPSRRRAWVPVLALACLALAAQLQITTIVAAGAIGIFVVLFLATRPQTRALLADAKMRRLAFALLVLAAAAGAVVVYLGLPRLLEAEPWAEKHKYNYLFYHVLLSRDYRLFWYLMPLAAFAALARYPRLTAYCLALWLIPLFVHSFGGMKADRYISYAFTFFLTFWGIALACALPWLKTAVVRTLDCLQEACAVPLGERIRAVLVPAILVFCALSVIAVNKLLVDSPKLIAKGMVHFVHAPAGIFRNPPDPEWDRGLAAIRRDLDGGAVLVGVDELRTTLYLQTPNFGMYLPPAPVTFERNGFTIDKRNGRPVIENVEDLERVFSCLPRGVLLIPARRWEQYGFLDEPMARFITARTKPGPPRIPGFYIYRWQHPVNRQGCEAVRKEARLHSRSAPLEN